MSHPEVVVDPSIEVTSWSLSDQGIRRVHALVNQPWIAEVGRLVSSPEVKARQTADILANHLGLSVEEQPASGEVDRSATGVVSHDRHKELAGRLFAEPERSAAGWERAIDAQQRVIKSLGDVLATPPVHSLRTNTVVVGHGGVGTLLYCHLARLAINRGHDQPGQGHYWAYDISTQAMLHGWRAIDDLEPDVDLSGSRPLSQG